MHMLVCIIIFITSCNTTFRPVPTFAYQCMSVSYVVCSLDACLLGWHLEPIVMNCKSYYSRPDTKGGA